MPVDSIDQFPTQLHTGRRVMTRQECFEGFGRDLA
jgi:hypothetical protein